MDRQSSMQYLEVVVSECCGICLVMSGKGDKNAFFYGRIWWTCDSGSGSHCSDGNFIWTVFTGRLSL